MRYLALIPRIAHTARKPPGSTWRVAFSSDQLSVWTPRTAEPAAPLSHGCYIGLLDSAATSADQVVRSWGAYVVLAEGRDGVTIWRDPSGRIPAYWWRGRDVDVICSQIEDLAGYLDAPMSIVWDVLAAQLLGDYLQGRRTALAGVQELLPGEMLTIDGPRVRTCLFWDPAKFWARPHRTIDDASAAFRTAAESSVALWAQRHPKIALDLSGGLDSSAVLGLLARLDPSPQVTAFNGRVRHEESDERRFARLAAEAAGVRLIEADVSETITDYARRTRPALQPRPTPQLRGAGLDDAGLRLAREVGATAYFTGRGGDHLFYASAPTTIARDYLRGRLFPSGFPRLAYEVARATRQPLTRVLRDAVHPRAAVRTPAELVHLGNPFLTREAAAAGLSQALGHPWAVDAVQSAPAGKILQVFHLIELQRHYDRMARAEQLQEVHPFISQPMLEACLRTPSYMFIAGGRPRGLQRRVFGDLLPAEIMDRQSKGASTSHSIRTLLANLPYLRERLIDGDLVREGLLERQALETHLTSASLLDGRLRPALADCVSAQLWLDDARANLSGSSQCAAGRP